MRSQTYIFIDVEATLIRGKQYIIEIGAVKWLPNGKKDTFSQLIQPYRFKKLNYHIQKLTGITTEQLLHAPTFKEVMKEFVNWCNGDSIFVTFGEFDRKVLEDEFSRNHMNCHFLYPIVDFQQKYMIEYQMKEQPSLGSLMNDYSITIETQHRALADAISLLKLFEATNGEEIIEKQKTNEFAILLSEFRQREYDYELSLTYISGNISSTNVTIHEMKTFIKHLSYVLKEEERVSKEGEIQIVQTTEICPDKEVELFLQQIIPDLRKKVLITRSGLRQLSRINRLHQCIIPKTEVMTLQNLIKDEEIVKHFTTNGQSIRSYEEKIYQLLYQFENNIIEEFKKRNLFVREIVKV